MTEKCETLSAVDAEEITERDNLAVVLRVERLEAIPNKDRIELVHLKDNGYTTICEKGHKVGDLVVFIKYDTVLPKNELFEWMKDSKYRVKSKSFTERDEEDNIVKKIYSQGIVLPLKVVVDFHNKQQGWDNPHLKDVLEEGTDLTSDLEVKKYIPPVTGGGSSFGNMQSKGDFPSHIVSKTDETNVCSKVRALEEIQGKEVYITLKIEGSSLTTMWDEPLDELMVCSRNNQIGEHETNKFWQVVNKYNLKEKMKDATFIIQGELYGNGVQKNKLGIEGNDIAVFNIVDKLSRQRANYETLLEVCKELEIPTVPVLCVIPSFDWTFDQLQEFADKQVYANGEIAEGIVIRPTEPFYSKVLKEDFSIKCINREYKL